MNHVTADLPAVVGSSFVRITGLVKRYGSHAAIDHVSFGVGEGHTLALLGPSGCGKTTMLRCIAGLDVPDEGRIEIGGQVVFDSARRINFASEARGLGIVFQSYAIWPHMTVAQNVGFPLRVRGMDKAEQRDRVRRMLDIVGLGAWAERGATQLSGGQQQRVALARALVHEPRLVLFDEALSNLDAQLREQVRLELAMLQARLGFTAIYVTHDQAEAFGLAETLVVMNKGRIETRGAPRDIFSRPGTPFTARFLGLNVIEGTLLRSDAGMAEVTLRNGAVVRGRAGLEGPLAVGTPVVVCVRREHVQVVGDNGEQLAEGDCGMAGVVRAASFQGLSEEYILDVDGLEWRSVQPAAGRMAGGRVQVRIAPQDCIVLATN